MFVTPDWDDGGPKPSAKFAKKIKAKKAKIDLALKSWIEPEKDDQVETKPPKKGSKQLLSVFQVPETKPKKKKKKKSPEQITSPSKNFVINPNKEKQNLRNENTSKIKANDIFDSSRSPLALKTNAKVKSMNKTKKKSMQFLQEPHTQVKSLKVVDNNKLEAKLTNGQAPLPNKSDKIKPSIPEIHENIKKITSEPNTKSPNTKKRKLPNSFDETIDYSSDKPDEVLLNIKKKKFNDSLDIETEDSLFKEQLNPVKRPKKPKKEVEKIQLTKADKRKEQLKKALKVAEMTNRNPIKTKGALLRQKMLEKLKSAQFRFLNEQLYTTTGAQAQQLFQLDPTAFQTYHEGYQQQIKKWPVNPLDVIIKRIMKLPKTSLIADMGCGEAKLAERLSNYTIRSFDLVACGPRVEACDMAATPLLTSSVDVAVYCLALMGTTITQYLIEANRVLKTSGLLLIAEVESRFDDADAFAKEVQKLGFKLVKLDKSQNVFFFMEFKKMQECGKKQRAHLSLKPCYYKRR